MWAAMGHLGEVLQGGGAAALSSKALQVAGLVEGLAISNSLAWQHACRTL